MENIDKRKVIKIVNEQGTRSLIVKPNFHSCIKITEEMVTVEMSRITTEHNEPIYTGFSVLELSK